MIMSSRIFIPRAFVLLFLVKAISKTSGIVIVKQSETKDNSTNALVPNVKINYTTITDNNIEVPTKQHRKTPSTSHKSTITSAATPHTVLNGLLNSSEEIITTKLPLSTVNFTSQTSMNFSTIAPTGHHAKPSSHKYYKVLLYVLIPLSAVLLAIGICFMIRHIQKVKRKRRLERELIHQYSYPNSEADDDQERLFEVESIINTQFCSGNDQEEKNFDAGIPQVSVAVGEGSKLVIEEESPLMDDVEASTSFNC